MIIKIEKLNDNRAFITDISKIKIDFRKDKNSISFLFDKFDIQCSADGVTYTYDTTTTAINMMDIITEQLEKASFNNDYFVNLTETKLIQLLNEKDLNNLPKTKNKMKS